MKFKIMKKENYTIIHFELEENITPRILKDLNPPKVDGTKGVLLSGRGPIWLYCHLTHHYHPTKFVATYDPRVGGAVVVESHDDKFKPGDIIQINEL